MIEARLSRSLVQWLDHLAAGETAKEEKERRKAAFDRMANETAFTYLNRLAASRMCEERDLVVECVRKGPASAGFQLYERWLARRSEIEERRIAFPLSACSMNWPSTLECSSTVSRFIR